MINTIFNKKHFSLAIFITIFLHSFLFAETTLNNKLTDSEKATISEGKVIIRNIDSLKDLALSSDNEGAKKVQDEAKNLKPAYIAEIIQIKPYKGNETLIDKLSTLIMDIPSYVGIPYYSVRAEEWYDLYSSARIISEEKKDNFSKVFADLEMEPFGLIHTQIDTVRTTDYFYYESQNLNKLRYYDKFNCVNPNKMKSLITAYRDGDNIVLYGIGAVNAPSIFFLRDRVETSFMNRINTFCTYFFNKL